MISFLFPSDSDVFHEQSGGTVEFHGARRWAGLQSEQEHTGSCGLQSGPGQEERETEGGERRVSPGGGFVGRRGIGHLRPSVTGRCEGVKGHE